MSKEQIQGNKLIAEFMGHRFTGDGVKKAYCMYLPDQQYWSFSAWNVEGYPDSLDEKIEAYFKYHDSWDWLMPVVEKIEATQKFSVEIELFSCFIIESSFFNPYPIFITKQPTTMSNFFKRTKRASEEIAYDEFHKGMKENNVIGTNYEGKGTADSEITRLQNISIAMSNDIEDKRNKIMLLKKALVRMVAEFDTTTPVIPNQKRALEYANELLIKMMNE